MGEISDAPVSTYLRYRPSVTARAAVARSEAIRAGSIHWISGLIAWCRAHWIRWSRAGRCERWKANHRSGCY